MAPSRLAPLIFADRYVDSGTASGSPEQTVRHVLNATEWLLRFVVAIGCGETHAAGAQEPILGTHPSFGTWAAALDRLPSIPAAPQIRTLLFAKEVGSFGHRRWADLASLRNWLAHGNLLDPDSALRLSQLLVPLYSQVSLALHTHLDDATLVWSSPGGWVDTSTGGPIEATADLGDGVHLVAGRHHIELAPLVKYGPAGFFGGGPEAGVNTVHLFLNLRNGTPFYTPLDEQSLVGIGTVEEAAAYRHRFTDQSNLTSFWPAAEANAAGMIGRAEELSSLTGLFLGSANDDDPLAPRRWRLLAGPGTGKSLLADALAVRLRESAPGRVVLHHFGAGDARATLSSFVTMSLEALGMRVADRPEEAERALERALRDTSAIFICDGLDELVLTSSGRDSDLRRLVELSAAGGRWLFAGRPSSEVAGVVGDLAPALPGSLPPMSDPDLAALLGMRSSPRMQDLLAESQAGGDFIAAVLRQADGLPMYVALTADALERLETATNVQAEVERIAANPRTLDGGLGALYDRAFDTWGVGDLDTTKTTVLGLLAAAAEPLSSRMLTELCLLDIGMDSMEDRRRKARQCDQSLVLFSAVLSQEVDLDDEPGYRIAHDSFRRHVEQARHDLYRRNLVLLGRSAALGVDAPPVLAKHLYRHGIGYLLKSSGSAAQASALLCDSRYLLARLDALGSTGTDGLFADVADLAEVADLDRSTLDCIEYLRTRRGLLERGVAEWGPGPILEQILRDADDDGEPVPLVRHPLTAPRAARLARKRKVARARIWPATTLRVPDLVYTAWVVGGGGILIQTYDGLVLKGEDPVTRLAPICTGQAIPLANGDLIVTQAGGSWLFDTRLNRFVARLGPPWMAIHQISESLAVVLDDQGWYRLELPSANMAALPVGRDDSVVPRPGAIATRSAADGTATLFVGPSLDPMPLARDTSAVRPAGANDVAVVADYISVFDATTGEAKSSTGRLPRRPSIVRSIGPDRLAWFDGIDTWTWSYGSKPVKALIGTLRYHMKAFRSLGDRFVMGYGTGPTLVWEAATGAVNHSTGPPFVADDTLVLRDGSILAWNQLGALEVWDIDQGGTVGRVALAGHLGKIDGAVEMRDGGVATWGSDFAVRLWKKASWTGADPASVDQSGVVVDVLGLTESDSVAFRSGGPTARVYEYRTTDQRVRNVGRSSVAGAALGPDGDLVWWTDRGFVRRRADQVECDHAPRSVMPIGAGRVVVWYQEEDPEVWDLPAGSKRAVLGGFGGRGSSGLVLSDRSFVTWRIGEPPTRWTVDEQTGAVAMASTFAAADGSIDRCVRAWDLRDGRLATANGRGELRVWQADTGRLLHRLSDPSLVMPGVHATGSSLLTWVEGGLPLLYDFRITVWDLPNQAISHRLAGHTHRVVGAIGLDDGRWASWSLDGTVRKWSAEGVLIGASTPVGSIVGGLTNGGRSVAVWTSDGTVSMFDLSAWAIVNRTVYEEALGPSAAFVEPGTLVIGGRMPEPLILQDGSETNSGSLL